MSLPNGVTSTYDFDGTGRLNSLAHNRGTTLLSNFQYSYDLSGNRLQAVEDVRQLVRSAGTGTPPGWTPPAQFAVEEAGYLAVTLAWPDSAIEEDGYTLERSTDGQNWIAVAELNANTLRYVDYGLARHTRYWYRLTAHNSQGNDSPQTVQAETAAEPVNIGEAWVEGEVVQTAIDYRYDSLYRLTEANYSDGAFFHYAYDSNGNRVSETTEVGMVESVYDAANRLTGVGAYAWDANGNLVNDGGRAYSYNTANRLTGVTQNGQTVNYGYNGLGDRLVEGATQFEMDLNTGLTQVLADGTNTHLYGNGRIGQFTGVDSAYFLGDALGSVRQLVNGSGDETMSRNYTPYGEVMNITGGRTSSFGFTNEYTSQGLIYLRARWYSPYEGRFLSADMWEGDFQSPMSYNVWLYVSGNPVIYSDPTGLSPAFTRIPEFEDVYNEKEKPGGVSFVPISDPLRKGAGGLEVKDGAQYYLGDENTGLCGLTSLTAVLYSVDGSITAEEVVTDYIDNTWVLDKGSNQVIHGNPNYISLEALKRYFQKSKYIRNVYGHWSAMWQKTYDDLPTSKLSGWLASGEILIAGVEISGTGKLISSQKTRDRYEQVTDYWGKYYDLKREGNSEEVIKSQIGTQPALCQKGSGGICHFVVITGVSSNWFDIYSDRNWVRIYNPYDNQTEYYKWKDFSASRSNIAGQVLRLAFHRNEKYCREGGVCMR